jgi:hypothetical protein
MYNSPSPCKNCHANAECSDKCPARVEWEHDEAMYRIWVLEECEDGDGDWWIRHVG